MAISRSLQPRQQYGLGSFVKKITKPIKKIVKSPLGKAALLGLGAYYMPGIGAKAAGGWGPWASKIGGAFGKKGALGNLFYSGTGAARAFSPGKAALMGLLGAGTIMPFLGGKDDEEEDEGNWWEPSEGISALRNQAKNYYTSATPDYKGSPFMPQKQYVMPNFYAAHGGRAGLLNGGEAGQAQAEQMLRMQYQKYRNQGGTMSYQQFKMAVLQQAQGQGPMAQAANGGRIGYAFGRGPILDPDAQEGPISPFQIQQEEGVPMGLSASNAENESLLEMLIEKFMDHPFNLPRKGAIQRALLELEKMSQGGGEEVIEEDVEYARDGGRIGAEEGGIMDLGGMEKDYRQEGGFVPLGEEEKADDVPARLSKNEFVFTADAVRAAGGGDIDAGAEVMENVMQNLEEGGEISEESQGQGAQGMYDNMQQLQSRIA